VSPNEEENSTKSKAFLPEKGGSTPWFKVIGEDLSESAFRAATLPLESELVVRHARDRKSAIAERNRSAPAPLIGPSDPPVNVIGGYRFPGAPEINLRPTLRVFPAIDAEIANLIANIPKDLRIPEFLRIPAAAAASKKREAA
jgi:hypothetical protein